MSQGEIQPPGPPHKIDSIFAFTDKALGELVAYLEQWFGPKIAAAAKAATSLKGYIRFNSANVEATTRWLDITTNDADTDGYGTHLADTATSADTLIENTGGGTLIVQAASSQLSLATGAAALSNDTAVLLSNTYGQLFLGSSFPAVSLQVLGVNAHGQFGLLNSYGLAWISTHDFAGTNLVHIGVETPATTVQIGTTDSTVTVTSGNALTLNALADLVANLATSGKKFVINDHTNNPIFEVRDDGSVHIKNGQTITADL